MLEVVPRGGLPPPLAAPAGVLVATRPRTTAAAAAASEVTALAVLAVLVRMRGSFGGRGHPAAGSIASSIDAEASLGYCARLRESGEPVMRQRKGPALRGQDLARGAGCDIARRPVSPQIPIAA